MPNHNFLPFATAEINNLTVCIVVNGEKIQSSFVTLTLIRPFPYITISSSFKLMTHYFFSYRVHRHTHRQTDRRTDMSTLQFRLINRNSNNIIPFTS